MIGTIVFSTNLDYVLSMIGLSNVCILDMNDMGSALDPCHPQITPATCLLPPPDALVAECDGDAELFTAIYEQYLISDLVVEFVSIVLAVLFRGGTVIMYMENLPEDSIWFNMLLQHLFIHYGLKIGTSIDNPFYLDPRYISSNAELVYMINGMSGPDFLRIHADEVPLNPYIVNKLLAEFTPFLNGQDPFMYFTNLKKAYKLPMKNPIKFIRGE